MGIYLPMAKHIAPLEMQFQSPLTVKTLYSQIPLNLFVVCIGNGNYYWAL